MRISSRTPSILMLPLLLVSCPPLVLLTTVHLHDSALVSPLPPSASLLCPSALSWTSSISSRFPPWPNTSYSPSLSSPPAVPPPSMGLPSPAPSRRPLSPLGPGLAPRVSPLCLMMIPPRVLVGGRQALTSSLAVGCLLTQILAPASKALSPPMVPRSHSLPVSLFFLRHGWSPRAIRARACLPLPFGSAQGCASLYPLRRLVPPQRAQYRKGGLPSAARIRCPNAENCLAPISSLSPGHLCLLLLAAGTLVPQHHVQQVRHRQVPLSSFSH